MELEPQLEPLSCLFKAYLDGRHNFDGDPPDGDAFETALASLGATRGYEDPIRAALARSIIALAKLVSAIPSGSVWALCAPSVC